ncbi:HipA domain-containing protein [Niabella hibiscisoli]|uniref:hypothetical protein n=1 Tax=Niabella hibiscisoli TaxID=1825928 RepID=UPI001F0CFB44|nr:hypothetical protein [Niabella hibiscisoli]MCH5716106.1 hypothetical protein [Niabella hibiscisoli]
MIFDAVISNTDRHQENWAFIGKTTFLSEALKQVEDNVKVKGFKKLPLLLKPLYHWMFDRKKNELSKKGKVYKLIHTEVSKTAPIYDSGSSLARELNNNRIDILLKNDAELKNILKMESPSCIGITKNVLIMI